MMGPFYVSPAGLSGNEWPLYEHNQNTMNSVLTPSANRGVLSAIRPVYRIPGVASKRTSRITPNNTSLLNLGYGTRQS